MTRFWLAFTTTPSRERSAHLDLLGIGFRARLPMIERIRVLRGKRTLITMPALRGYVFVEFPPGEIANERLHAVVTSKYVNRVVGFNGQPGRITEHVMAEFVSKLEEPEAHAPQFQLRPGAQVSIKKGPFADLPGVIQGIHGDSATVLVRLFRRSCQTKVGLIQLEELNTGTENLSSREKRRLQGARKSGTLHAG